MSVRSAIEIWRAVLVGDTAMPPMQAVVKQLADYFGRSIDEISNIAGYTSDITTRNWLGAAPSTSRDLQDLSHNASNWVIEDISYHARQAEGQDVPNPPFAVQVAENSKEFISWTPSGLWFWRRYDKPPI